MTSRPIGRSTVALTSSPHHRGDRVARARAARRAGGGGRRGRSRARRTITVRRRRGRRRTRPPRAPCPDRRPQCGRRRGAIVTRSASAPASIRPASGQPSEAWPPPVAAGQQRGGVVTAALAARQALVELDRARLLEQVDHRVRVGARARGGAPASSRARAGPIPSARSRSVVGQKQQQLRAAEQARCRRRSGGWRGRR